jgi:hypothetical protein
MLKRTSLRVGLTVGLLVLALALALTGTVLAQEPVLPQDSDPTWRASYWNNTTLSGPPVLQQDESELNHDWGSGSPHWSVSADGFSARWTRYIYVDAGTYRFTSVSDDGIRVWVDNDLIIDAWYDHPAKTVSADKSLSEGHHWVVVEFYENQGLAVARLRWEPASTPINNWRGEYFNNTSLSGAPALVRDDAAISFDWGSGSPAPGTIGADRFSARWTRTLNLPAGRYRFAMTVDDGGRLWVNNHLLLESWRDQPATTYTEEIYLPGGPVPIKMEYYENGGYAVARMSWELLPPDDVQNWRGEYYANTSLGGAPARVRDDARVDFDWGYGSPLPGVVGADWFSVRWTRTVNMTAGRYRFAMTVDDGGRLWVNGRLVIDAWRDQAARTYTADVDLSGGAVPIKMEYYENAGLAVARLSWSEIGTSPGAVVVDDADPGFVKGGSITGWHTASEGYGGRLTWTRNNDWQHPGYNWARWYPSLAPGRYEVFAFIPYRYTTTASARYLVSYDGGYATRVVDQSTSGDRWVSLGTYWFGGGGDNYVELTDVTGEPRLSRLIAFDAVKWEPR